jgi:hypothetical protein
MGAHPTTGLMARELEAGELKLFRMEKILLGPGAALTAVHGPRNRLKRAALLRMSAMGQYRTCTRHRLRVCLVPEADVSMPVKGGTGADLMHRVRYGNAPRPLPNAQELHSL